MHGTETITSGNAAACVFALATSAAWMSALAWAFALSLILTATLAFLRAIWKWRSRHEMQSQCPAARVDARVEAIRSLNVENSYRAIRIILRNRGETKTTVEEIVLTRNPGWLEFGIIGPLVRLGGLSPWRFNAGFASRKTVTLPVTLDVNDQWESFVPLEPEDPNNKEEMRQFERLRFNEALKVLRSGAMRYSIQLANQNLAGPVSLGSY